MIAFIIISILLRSSSAIGDINCLLQNPPSGGGTQLHSQQSTRPVQPLVASLQFKPAPSPFSVSIQRFSPKIAVEPIPVWFRDAGHGSESPKVPSDETVLKFYEARGFESDIDVSITTKYRDCKEYIDGSTYFPTSDYINHAADAVESMLQQYPYYSPKPAALAYLLKFLPITQQPAALQLFHKIVNGDRKSLNGIVPVSNFQVNFIVIWQFPCISKALTYLISDRLTMLTLNDGYLKFEDHRSITVGRFQMIMASLFPQLTDQIAIDLSASDLPSSEDG